MVWGWQGLGAAWPALGRQVEWRLIGAIGRLVEQVLVVSAVGLAAGVVLQQVLDMPAAAGPDGWIYGTPVSLGCCGQCGRDAPEVTVERSADGRIAVELCGHFTLAVAADDPFRVRLLALFLRQLELPGERRGSRRTRDGRTPFVRQVYLADAMGIVHPDLSRWERYFLVGDWRRLLSLHTTDVLTLELQARIVAVFATFPWWGVEKVHDHLRGQGVAVSLSQVRQAAQESGWTLLRAELMRRYHLSAESIRPRDGWLVDQLLAQLHLLLGTLEAKGGLTPHQQIDFADLQTLAAEVGADPAAPPVSGLPWLLRLEQWVFGHWQPAEGDPVRCPSCGSDQVATKSKTPRYKRFYDQAGATRSVAVYRYYCKSPACPQRSFTHLPADLVPYSPFRVQTRLLAVQVYAWGYSTYRRTGSALGVAPLTVYRWVSRLGPELLPIAALFGVVRSSGVVGIDEKYVLVPKNNKPAGKMRRWMYVYFAVDLYTCDLLHIAIYPHNTQESAHAFLLALRAKGYSPQVVVTDLRDDYSPVIAGVFPQATHHLCIFHALQNLQAHLKDAYGNDFAETSPDALALRRAIRAIFDTRTRRTAAKRYADVMALRDDYVAQNPQAAAVFDFLVRHWPRLVNAIAHPAIPTTNNATERVIRRFDQHYQSFCGFQNLHTAHAYLAVFEKLYRFTPFSDDAAPLLRGLCPLQIAGYDIASIPASPICAGFSPDWPLLPPPLPPPSGVPSP